MRNIDPTTLAVIRGALEQIADEMDTDRYTIDGETTQVLLGTRELGRKLFWPRMYLTRQLPKRFQRPNFLVQLSRIAGDATVVGIEQNGRY